MVLGLHFDSVVVCFGVLARVPPKKSSHFGTFAYFPDTVLVLDCHLSRSLDGLHETLH